MLVCNLSLAACTGIWGGSAPGQGVAPVPKLSGTPSWTPFQPEGSSDQAGDLPASPLPPASTPVKIVASPTPASLWISPAVPASLRQAAGASGLSLAASSDAATARLDILNPKSTINNQQSSIWFYALVTPFPTLTDGVSLTAVMKSWAGQAVSTFAGRPLWMDPATLAAFSVFWGPPADGAVRVVAADQLVDSAWADRPSWAIVPFEALEPRWKVLSVDGQSPVHNDFDPSAYPLKVTFSLQPALFSLPATNRDPAKLTVLAMTGTTALVRATADRMEKHGVLYPGEEIRSVLRAADLTHVSNEISFTANCPTPDPWTESLVFCSDPRYIALLEDVGVDIVELTGNHLLDYGPAAFLNTLDMYDQQGWKYYGGGRDLAGAESPLLLENNGNKLAFIGCNFAGPPGDWATADRPGSAPCDFAALDTQITGLRSQGYLPVMTFQYQEYYQTAPTAREQADFRQVAQAGAVIVSGSQSHMPASMEFLGGSFIHYGPGNLFFDQMSHQMPDGSLIYDTRNVFVDRHIFYAGRYIGTELLTYILEDYSRPRPMTDQERSQFLQNIFTVSGW